MALQRAKSSTRSRWVRALVPALLALSGAPSAPGADDATAPTAGAELSADEIYQRYSERKNTESFQKVRILSRDPGGSEQLSQFELLVQDARDAEGKASRGVRFRTRVDVHDPFDMRHTKYLIITKESGPDDEFVYQPSARRVRRVDLTDTSFLGTDYQFGDFAVDSAEEGSRVRLPDEVIEGRPVFVIENTLTSPETSPYHKRMLYLEQAHYLPLRVRSWNELGVEVKEMTAPAASIRAFGDVWVTTESTVRDLMQKTSSTLYIDELDPEPRFHRNTFSSGRLGRGK